VWGAIPFEKREVGNTIRLKKGLSVLAAFALILLATGLVISQRGVIAQDAVESHPAHIHSGNCTELGDVVYPLSDVSESSLVNGTPIAGAVGGAADAVPVALSGTTVAAPLADLLGSPFAINIHESADNIGNYIACGTVGGALIGTSDVAFGLSELNGSGYSGVATLHDNGDGTTAVSVYLTEAGAAEGAEMTETETEEATVVAETETQTDTAAMTGAAAVDIANFAFNPGTIEVAVGDTVTWTNSDSAAHTATQLPSGSGFQSGTLDPGASYSFTFDTPGTYDYHCEFHAGMTGQVIVS
jgi:plastocyanin